MFGCRESRWRRRAADVCRMCPSSSEGRMRLLCCCDEVTSRSMPSLPPLATVFAPTAASAYNNSKPHARAVDPRAVGRVTRLSHGCRPPALASVLRGDARLLLSHTEQQHIATASSDTRGNIFCPLCGDSDYNYMPSITLLKPEDWQHSGF